MKKNSNQSSQRVIGEKTSIQSSKAAARVGSEDARKQIPQPIQLGDKK